MATSQAILQRARALKSEQPCLDEDKLRAVITDLIGSELGKKRKRRETRSGGLLPKIQCGASTVIRGVSQTGTGRFTHDLAPAQEGRAQEECALEAHPGRVGTKLVPGPRQDPPIEGQLDQLTRGERDKKCP